MRAAFDLNKASPRDLDRYGNNAFGWSLLMAARLVEAGVNLVQVNLGNNETWDTHGNAFPAPEGQASPADGQVRFAPFWPNLEQQRSAADDTLIIMAGGVRPHPAT